MKVIQGVCDVFAGINVTVWVDTKYPATRECLDLIREKFPDETYRLIELEKEKHEESTD